MSRVPGALGRLYGGDAGSMGFLTNNAGFHVGVLERDIVVMGRWRMGLKMSNNNIIDGGLKALFFFLNLMRTTKFNGAKTMAYALAVED